ncbi:MAG TPA: carboxypeptidase-like regulatory domain-containing protein, partial [Candidatus Binatus sp.]|nr:carboxypeptidase-like regulatory domain-containing protein [Candidatus Binatus sp.]
MKASKLLIFGVLVIAVAAILASSPEELSSQQSAAVRIDGDDIGGAVTSDKGLEAGVWVIAETTELPTKLAKIVVTDDQGRYVIPDLPRANYNVWVRGYGLIDSAKVRGTPGKILNLKAVVAPSEAAAAQYYPAIYWYSMLKVPDKSLFPGTGEKGNGMAENIKSQGQWLDGVKTNGCITCHQLGNKATRTIPKELGEFKSSTDAWSRRIVSGQAMTNMSNSISRL